jgi:hypothetical protein
MRTAWSITGTREQACNTSSGIFSLVGGIWQYAFAPKTRQFHRHGVHANAESTHATLIKHELVLNAQTVAVEHRVGNIWNAEKPMRDIGRQMR